MHNDPQTDPLADLIPERLDQALVARGLAPSRAQARDAVKRGLVVVNGAVETKPAARITKADSIKSAGGAWVSRGAEKLLAALEAFDVSILGRTALDVGASTGGFTQVLLARGVLRVYAIDVGRGQLHPTLAVDPRVIAHEGLDARQLDADTIPELVSLIVADVSFIGLAKALPRALSLTADHADLIALVKPQFEVGPALVGKGGIVRDATVRATALQQVVAAIEENPGWRVKGHIPSPITGGDGNIEYLLWAAKR